MLMTTVHSPQPVQSALGLDPVGQDTQSPALKRGGTPHAPQPWYQPRPPPRCCAATLLLLALSASTRTQLEPSQDSFTLALSVRGTLPSALQSTHLKLPLRCSHHGASVLLLFTGWEPQPGAQRHEPYVLLGGVART